MFKVAVDNFRPDDTKAQFVATACLDSAMLEAVQSFNIEDHLDNLLEGLNFSKAGFIDETPAK